MRLVYVLWAAVSVLIGTASARAQNVCPVTAHGAKGDCVTDDTAAFQAAADQCGSFFIPRPSKGCYRVNGIRLQAGSTITFEDRSAELRPVSPRTPYVFSIRGQSIASPASYTTIRNGALWAPFRMNAGTAGIRIDYGNHVRLEDMFINGFYNDIFADNTEYLYLMGVSAHGAQNANLWQQQSDVHHGPYFGGPLYIENSTLDSCQCSAASIWVQDIAVVNITDSDIVGVTEGEGLHADSSNGQHASNSDYPAGIHVHGSTFDSVAREPIWIQNYIKSDIQGTWVSGGRTRHTPCIRIGDNVRDLSISETHVFWCGTDGLVLQHVSGVKVSNSTFSGTPEVGIHNMYATDSFFFGNTCDAKSFNGNGASSQKFCVYEEGPANNNTYLKNDAVGTTYGNSYHGKNSMALQP